MRTVLIADDQPGVLQTLDFVMGLRGYRTLLANSGKAALELAVSASFDAALIDLHMPGQDGIATCRALRERCIAAGSDRPVFMMTAAYEQQAAAKAADAGAVMLLRKPFDYDEFFAALDRFCTGELPVPALPVSPRADGDARSVPPAAA